MGKGKEVLLTSGRWGVQLRCAGWGRGLSGGYSQRGAAQLVSVSRSGKSKYKVIVLERIMLMQPKVCSLQL